MFRKSIARPAPPALSAHVACAAFLALFPGFFFYQSALGAGAIGAVLGGYFSPVTLAFLPFLVFVYLQETMRDRRFLTRNDLNFWAFLVFFALVAGFNHAFGAPRDVVMHHALAISHFIAVFIIFRLADFEAASVRRVCVACLAGMTAIIFYMSVDGFFYLRLQGSAGNAEVVATYQGFARSYLATALIVLPFAGALPLRLGMVAVVTVALFMNGARSELMAFLILVAVIEVFRAGNKGRRLLLLSALVLAGTGLLLYADRLIDLLPANRSLQLLDLANASSWEARNFLLSEALDTIAEHPLLGDYGSYFHLFASSGSYAHNIFSAWVDLGFAGFVWLLCMIVLPLRRLGAALVAGKESAGARGFMLTFSLLFVTFVMLIAAKSFTYMMIGAALGLHARYSHSARHSRHRKESLHAQSRAPHFRSLPQRHADLRQAMP
ncbi:MAG TPA: O-antigen ligase family protein [Paucimonas sp.]|nr:O-antigen ligase family protein [Paucimonas sp.]